MSRGRSPEPIGGNECYTFGARRLRIVGDRSDPAPGHMAGFGADVAGYAGVYLGRGISIFAAWYYLVLHSRMAAC
jgi:hypothetical protein